MVIALDETDRRLLSLLRQDARRPVAKLAAALGVSRGTVQNRIAKLRRAGVILGFTVRLKPDSETAAVRAITLIAVEGRSADKVLAALRGLPGIRALHMTNGRWDIIAELETENLAAFDQILRDIRMIDGITSTETNILLTTYKY